MRLSTAPVWNDGELVPRPFVLRVFATVTPDGWQVMPGGFCRNFSPPRRARRQHGRRRAVGRRVGAVVQAGCHGNAASGNRQCQDSAGFSEIFRAAPPTICSGMGAILNAQKQRCASCAVFARAVSKSICRLAMYRSRSRILAHQLVAWGAVSPENEGAQTLTIVRQALCDEEANGSGLSGVRLARNAGSIIRERISVDASKLLRRSTPSSRIWAS